jgi:hypothetical protein
MLEWGMNWIKKSIEMSCMKFNPTWGYYHQKFHFETLTVFFFWRISFQIEKFNQYKEHVNTRLWYQEIPPTRLVSRFKPISSRLL